MLSFSTSNKNVCPKGCRTVHKGQFLMSFYNLFKKSNPNRTNLVIFFPFYKPSPDLPPHRSILQSQQKKKTLKARVTAKSQASHKRHNQQRQGKAWLRARPATGERSYESEGGTAREKPKSERIGAEEKDLDWPFGGKPDRLLV